MTTLPCPFEAEYSVQRVDRSMYYRRLVPAAPPPIHRAVRPVSPAEPSRPPAHAALPDWLGPPGRPEGASFPLHSAARVPAIHHAQRSARLASTRQHCRRTCGATCRATHDASAETAELPLRAWLVWFQARLHHAPSRRSRFRSGYPQCLPGTVRRADRRCDPRVPPERGGVPAPTAASAPVPFPPVRFRPSRTDEFVSPFQSSFPTKVPSGQRNHKPQNGCAHER